MIGRRSPSESERWPYLQTRMRTPRQTSSSKSSSPTRTSSKWRSLAFSAPGARPHRIRRYLLPPLLLLMSAPTEYRNHHPATASPLVANLENGLGDGALPARLRPRTPKATDLPSRQTAGAVANKGRTKRSGLGRDANPDCEVSTPQRRDPERIELRGIVRCTVSGQGPAPRPPITDAR